LGGSEYPFGAAWFGQEILQPAGGLTAARTG
jgi:hypothetical protein